VLKCSVASILVVLGIPSALASQEGPQPAQERLLRGRPPLLARRRAGEAEAGPRRCGGRGVRAEGRRRLRDERRLRGARRILPGPGPDGSRREGRARGMAERSGSPRGRLRARIRRRLGPADADRPVLRLQAMERRVALPSRGRGEGDHARDHGPDRPPGEGRGPADRRSGPHGIARARAGERHVRRRSPTPPAGSSSFPEGSRSSPRARSAC